MATVARMARLPFWAVTLATRATTTSRMTGRLPQNEETRRGDRLHRPWRTRKRWLCVCSRAEYVASCETSHVIHNTDVTSSLIVQIAHCSIQSWLAETLIWVDTDVLLVVGIYGWYPCRGAGRSGYQVEMEGFWWICSLCAFLIHTVISSTPSMMASTSIISSSSSV